MQCKTRHAHIDACFSQRKLSIGVDSGIGCLVCSQSSHVGLQCHLLLPVLTVSVQVVRAASDPLKNAISRDHL